MNNGGRDTTGLLLHVQKTESMYGKECTVIKTGNVKISEETR